MILTSKFIDRSDEINYLRNRYRSGKAELIVIYGRRRIGKTYILQRFLQEVGGIYLLAEESENVTADFSDMLAEFFNDDFLLENPIRTWNAFFSYLGERAKNKRLVVVIDEVQYIVKIHKNFLSILQKYWDTQLAKGKIMLILCGSLVSFMEGILSYSSPIYGRRTGSWEVKEMHYYDCAKFHNLPREEVIKIYSVFGGVPQYWSDYNPKKSFWENLSELVIQKGAKYHDEPRYLLKMELRDIARYFSILHTIASGYTTFGKIADKSGIDTNSLGKYLSVLENLNYISVEYSIGSRRKGIYKIKDNLFNFWFRFIYPHRSEIEMNIDIVPQIKKDFNLYVGERFEGIAKEFLMKINAERYLPDIYTQFGRWWHKGEEIDVVGVGEKSLLIAEVKWKNMEEKDIRRIIAKLEKKRLNLPIQRETTYYCVIAEKIKNKKLGENILLYDLSDLFLN